MRFIPLHSAIQQIRTGSVLAPLLALIAVTGSAAVLLTAVVRVDTLTWFVWSIFGMEILAFVVVYLIWAIRDPDRLQTEDYRLERHRIDVLGDERDPNNMKVIQAAPTSNTMIGTPP